LWSGDTNIDCGGGLHYGYCSYSYECAVSEGWAEFVSMRTWYPDDTDESEPILLTWSDHFSVEPGGHELPGGSPFSIDDCGSPLEGGDACPSAPIGSALWHDCYAKNEIMAMRAYWDMMDESPDGVDGVGNSVLWPYLVDIWELYPEGTANHQLDEPNSNMMDYLYNAAEISGTIQDHIESAMENNSMTYQDPG